MPDESELIALRAAAHTEVGCTFIMWRGHLTGNVITCGVCAWCRDHWSSREDGANPALPSQPTTVSHEGVS